MLDVLIIDDEDEFITMISAKLRKEGMNSHGFDSAKEGLLYLKNHKSETGLVVLDLLMPEMSGWVFIYEMVKANIKDIPVIVLTNLSNSDIPENTDIDIEMIIKTDISMKELSEKVKQKLTKSGTEN